MDPKIAAASQAHHEHARVAIQFSRKTMPREPL
jgi:hypothetical protein